MTKGTVGTVLIVTFEAFNVTVGTVLIGTFEAFKDVSPAELLQEGEVGSEKESA